MTMDYLLWVCSLIVPAVLAVEGTSFYYNYYFYYHYFCVPRMNNGNVWTHYW